jgi:tetratricopeptide (TPR) repeat protein
LDDDEAWGHAVLGMADLWFTQNHERSIAEEERAVSLIPNDATFRGFLSNVLCLGGRSEEALTEIEFAMRLNPHHPPLALHMIGRALLTLRRYGDALPHIERLVGTMPSNTNARAMLAACYAALDRIDDARTMIEEIAKISPTYSLREIPVRTPYKLEEDREHYLDLLRKAGLPE